MALKKEKKMNSTFQRFQRINHKTDWISLQLTQRQTMINLDKKTGYIMSLQVQTCLKRTEDKP